MTSYRFAPEVIVAVAAGGAAGTVARAAIEQASPTGSGFPWATFSVNVFGSLVLGLVVALLERAAPSRYLRPLLGTGLCGGFTTFSTFAVEIDSLVHGGRAGLAVAYAVASIAAGLLAVWAGMGIARLRRRREV